MVIASSGINSEVRRLRTQETNFIIDALSLIDRHDFSCFYLVDPPADVHCVGNELASFQKRNIILHSVCKRRERPKVNATLAQFCIGLISSELSILG